ncbi:hypothetical protein [uncultured Methylobacterium sp.]|jgi:hypothetical protein|uniref:hypothetical protein n=1 Tax=uncultured Methylobacterium sp. TaxID=157278 RepID=UPI0026265EFA|nr:hypothetical protein [uncultured Methylobacterium sp.]
MSDAQLACLIAAGPLLLAITVAAIAEAGRLAHHNGVELTLGWTVAGHVLRLVAFLPVVGLAVLTLLRARRP